MCGVIHKQQPVGYPVPWTFTATDGNVGNTITYGYVSSLYSNLFNFINSVGNPHLECAIVFDYDTMPVHQYIFSASIFVKNMIIKIIDAKQ